MPVSAQASARCSTAARHRIPASSPNGASCCPCSALPRWHWCRCSTRICAAARRCEMNAVLTPDVCIVGAGSAGLVVASGAAHLGLSAVLIERADMGGDCLNYGCVPSKALIAAAKMAPAQPDGPPFGIASVEPKVDFARVVDHVHQVIAAIAPNDSVERFEKLGVRVLKEEARFIGRTELQAGPHRIKSRRIVLATGSRPTAPPIPGLAEAAFLANETIFANRTLPSHLLVIGGGAVGRRGGEGPPALGW